MKTAILFRYVIFLFSFTAFSAVGFTQSVPVKEWDYRYGGSGGDDLLDIHQTSDGGYILGGFSTSSISGDKTTSNQGGEDFWMMKTDGSGTKLWDANFGGSDFDQLTSLQQTNDGGYILGGYSASGQSGDKSQPSQGGYDFWIVKTDSSGNKLWDARFGGSGDDVLRTLIQTSDGGYLLGGFSNSGISGDKTQDSWGDNDMWIVKTDSSGVKQWDYRYGGDQWDQLNSLWQTMEGGYILGGHSGSGISGDKTQASQGAYDYWIVKIDSAGTKEWDSRYGGSDYEYLYAIQQANDGGYILGGFSYSGISGDKTEASQGAEDLWILKTDAEGVKEWDHRYGGANNDYFVSVQQTTDGYLFGGYSDSDSSGDKSQDQWGVLFTYDYWIVKTDKAGLKKWDLDFGGTNWDQLSVARQTTDDGYILGGYSNSPVSGDKTQESYGGDDFWLVKLTCENTQKFFADEDGDGYGNMNSILLACGIPAGYVDDSTDCNDNDPNVNPGVIEIPGNGIDDDCDGVIDEVTTGIASIDETSSFEIYPNPASEYLTIDFSSPENISGGTKIELINSIGQSVYSSSLLMQLQSPTVIHLPETISNGIYLLKISLQEKIFSKTLEIEK